MRNAKGKIGSLLCVYMRGKSGVVCEEMYERY